MATLLYWLQSIGAFLTILLALGGLIAAFYTTLRETPQFVRRLTGYSALESKVDRLLNDHELVQELLLQQAKEFNGLSKEVGEAHDIPPRERPFVNPDKIREELMDADYPDFTRESARDD